MQSLGPRIKALRLEAQLNKAALARRVGVSDVTISYWESGAIKQIGHERLVALAQALECPLSRLLEGDGSGRAAPLYLRRHPPAPWQDRHAGRIDLPFELVPDLEWDGDCFLVTPAPDEPFDYLAPGDLVAMAPTETFRRPGLYLIQQEGEHRVRHVSQAEDGALRFVASGADAPAGYTPDTLLLGKLLARWQPGTL
ncbi:helix-turn-helix domain-containing protein [Halomonas sp.]|uniref:helix-turn-helix domain-containing protein n=1 Tax=Halomonas sp. TaxID=1486246 RepID=UPI003D1211BA